jgi:Tfp pilus assembly protein PilV
MPRKHVAQDYFVTMHTFFGTQEPGHRAPRRRRRGRPTIGPRPHVSDANHHPGSQVDQRDSEAGFLLIEVIISAMLVAMIVVATLSGFDVLNRTSADQRSHAEAALLAAQSQERLRSDPATALAALELAPHTYELTVGGTKYKIVQEARAVAANGSSTGCSVAEATAQTGANFQITSTVTWPALGKRTPVTQSSLITPPTGSALEIDVGNGAATPAGVAGVTAVAKFTPVNGGGSVTSEGTTGASGCIVLSGIPATAATVEILEKANFVTTSGALKYPTKEITIAPSITTHDLVTYNEGGRIVAEFTYKGETTWEGKPVESDTFVAFNSAIPTSPEWEVGSTAFTYEKEGEEHYKATTGTFSATASTATGVKYAKGDLFPFPENNWSVYAGDCTKDNVESAAGLVSPGGATPIKVPLSYVLLNVWTGTKGKPTGVLESTIYPVTVINAECASGGTPANASGTNLRHEQKTSAQGHLAHPFQPFGKYDVCMYNSATKRTDTASINNSTPAGSTVNFYPAETSSSERETAEAATRAARVTKEGEEKKAREATEVANHAARKTTEETERATWKAEEGSKKITETQRKEKEATQTKNRIAAEKAEKTAFETTENNKRLAAEKAESELKTQSVKEEGERGYTVASGKESC